MKPKKGKDSLIRQYQHELQICFDTFGGGAVSSVHRGQKKDKISNPKAENNHEKEIHHANDDQCLL